MNIPPPKRQLEREPESSKRNRRLSDVDNLKRTKDEEEDPVRASKPRAAEDLMTKQRQDNPVGRTGGIYIPPFRLALMKKEIKDKTSVEYQKEYWEALRKSINGYVNKANIDNIPNLIEEMFGENLIRARGLLARAVLRAQMASPPFSHVFAALLAVVNCKLPEVGRILIVRLLIQFRRAYKKNDKIVTLACLKFMAHLVNQKVLADVTALEVCALLLEKPTNDGVEVCCGFLQECGQVLGDLQPQALTLIFERLRVILNEGEVETRTQYTIEKLFEIRRKRFSDFPGVIPQLDLIEEDEQVTHTIDLLEEDLQQQDLLDIFKPVEPEQFAAEEKKWKDISNDILGRESGDERDGDASSSDSEVEAEQKREELEASGKIKITDCTEQDLVNLRKTVYLCIMSSASFEECVHKLLKLNIPQGQEIEVCVMLIDCCSMERTFSRFFALQGERLCRLRDSFRDAFLDCFTKQYAQVHRLETNKLRNVAKFFAHLFATAFEIMILTEDSTTAASRIFIKIIFQDLADELGMESLQAKLRDPDLRVFLHRSIFPKDSMANMRFSINFFTAIGLGALADDLRAFLQASRTKVSHQENTGAGEAKDSRKYEHSGSSSSSSYLSDSDGSVSLSGTESESIDGSSSGTSESSASKRVVVAPIAVSRNGNKAEGKSQRDRRGPPPRREWSPARYRRSPPSRHVSSNRSSSLTRHRERR